MARNYDLALATRPVTGSNGLYSAFIRGLKYPDKHIYLRNSLAYAWFAAGRDITKGRIK
jgi:hypothetical protein